MASPAGALPPPSDEAAPVGQLMAELARHLGESVAARRCRDLLEGADLGDHQDVLPYLARLAAATAAAGRWPEYWPRVWGARGLLYVWDDAVSSSVVVHLDDDSWRVAEMCLKVAAKRELAEAADGAIALCRHELARVRSAAVRALGLVGDTDHAGQIVTMLDDPDPQVRSAAARALDRARVRLDLPQLDGIDP